MSQNAEATDRNQEHLLSLAVVAELFHIGSFTAVNICLPG
jgi:hypothetical protein